MQETPGQCLLEFPSESGFVHYHFDRSDLSSVISDISCSGHVLRIRSFVNGSFILQLRPSVLGGKGGFGRLLKTQKSKKTDNFDSCRDLDGRRIRAAKRDERLDELKSKVEEKRSESLSKSKPPIAASVTLEEGYTAKLSEIRNEKVIAVAEGLRSNSTSLPSSSEPVPKKMKSSKLFDDDDDSD